MRKWLLRLLLRSGEGVIWIGTDNVNIQRTPASSGFSGNTFDVYPILRKHL